MRLDSLKRFVPLVVVAALAGAALVATSSGPAGAAEVPCRRTFTSGAIDEPIPDPGLVESTIDVPEDGLVVADVDVSVDVRHPDPKQLNVALGSRDDSAGGGFILTRLFLGDLIASTAVGADLIAGFDDEARIPVTWGRAPFAGTYLPLAPLAGQDGRVGGRYLLDVKDNSVTGAGTLKTWSVTLTYRSCDFDGDGVEDHVDGCRGVAAHTATGCPLTSRKVTARFRSGKFRGALSSPVMGCEARRPVSVFRKRPGPDRRLGTATTRRDGAWRLSRPRKPGRYYAAASRTVVPGVAECPAVVGRTFRVR